MKKLLMLLMILLLLASCAGKRSSKNDPVTEDGKYYIQKIKEYEVRKKNTANTTDNKEFDAFLDKVFAEAMEADYMTMHFNVIDYRSYGIEKPPVDLGELSYSFDEENFNYMKDQLEELQGFDFDSLSYRQQYDYEALEYSLYETLADYCYYRYNFLVSTGSCLPENLISNFTDYTFYDVESVDDYLTCLKDIDRYLDDMLTYTEAQAKDKLGPLDSWIDYTEDACKGVLNKTEDNELIVSFDKRMAQIDWLSDAQKEAYGKENKETVLNEVLPAYQKVLDEIEKYRGKKKTNDYALYKLDKDYAELVYILKGSNNKDLETVFQELKDNLSLLEAEYVSCFYDSDAYEKYQEAMDGKGAMSLVGKDCLEYLRLNLVAYFPDLGDVEYSVEELDPDTAPSTVIAYYWPSPIDNHNQNIIRTNPNNMSPGYETYGTLAHEGFPGHLYQHVYYYKSNPHNFRSAIGFIGYTEGWAVNSQYYAFQFADIGNAYAAAAISFEDAYYFILYSIIDMGVNYFGWTAKDISKYFEEESMLFNFSESDANYFRDFLIEMPGTYCSYGIGSSNFMTLCQETQNKMGDRFDFVSYHDALLKNGPLPFNILEGAVEEYISAH